MATKSVTTLDLPKAFNDAAKALLAHEPTHREVWHHLNLALGKTEYYNADYNNLGAWISSAIWRGAASTTKDIRSYTDRIRDRIEAEAKDYIARSGLPKVRLQWAMTSIAIEYLCAELGNIDTHEARRLKEGLEKLYLYRWYLAKSSPFMSG